MSVYVFGNRGMLGRYVESHLKSMGYHVIGVNRTTLDVSSTNEIPLRSFFFHRGITVGDIIINCMGAIKPQVDKLGTLNAIKVNSMFPHILANVCEEKDVKLIHITTDCVFSGNDGKYDENSLHDCTDVYGKTKSLGEPPNCTVVRTSIIGEEFGTSRSLIEWVKSMDGKTVNGYLNHQWNGLTCYQTAKVFEDIIRNEKYWDGVRHIHSPNSLNKHELVNSIVDAHELNIEVKPAYASAKCDRSLSTIHEELSTFDIPDILTQLKDQYNNPPNLEM